MFLWNIAVTSLAEVWIEIVRNWHIKHKRLSVTSLAEVWIEIGCLRCDATVRPVTSLAEVWIEIQKPENSHTKMWSLPLRKCGLK